MLKTWRGHGPWALPGYTYDVIHICGSKWQHWSLGDWFDAEKTMDEVL